MHTHTHMRRHQHGPARQVTFNTSTDTTFFPRRPPMVPPLLLVSSPKGLPASSGFGGGGAGEGGGGASLRPGGGLNMGMNLGLSLDLSCNDDVGGAEDVEEVCASRTRTRARPPLFTHTHLHTHAHTGRNCLARPCRLARLQGATRELQWPKLCSETRPQVLPTTPLHITIIIIVLNSELNELPLPPFNETTHLAKVALLTPT